MLRSCVLLSLVACSSASPPPPTNPYLAPDPPEVAAALAARPPSSQPPREVAPTPPAHAGPFAQGVVRVEGTSIQCSDVLVVDDDGGASVLCTFVRERGCAIRRVGPDGEERGRSELVPGVCVAWVPRGEGGGLLVTVDGKHNRWLTVAELDGAGKRGAQVQLTSRASVYPIDARLAPDGSVDVSLRYRADLSFRGKRLGHARIYHSAVVRFTPALERVAWARSFVGQRTDIAGLLPGTRGGVDTIVNTLDDVAPGVPSMNEDGNMFGGNSYGWTVSRVAIDARGKAVSREPLPIDAGFASDVTTLDDAVATIASDPNRANHTNLTILRPGAPSERTPLALRAWRFDDGSGKPWLLSCDCAYVNGKRTGAWKAVEVGGARRTILLPNSGAPTERWDSIALRGDRLVAIGGDTDPTSKLRVTTTALVRLPTADAVVDVARLRRVERVQRPAGCEGPAPEVGALMPQSLNAERDEAMKACGVAPGTRIEVSFLPEGGLDELAIAGAKPQVVACVRRWYEPRFACVANGGRSTFSVRWQ